MNLNLIFLIFASVLVIESLILFISPSGVKKMINEVLKIPDSTLRIFSMFIMLLGLLIVFLLKNKICI